MKQSYSGIWRDTELGKEIEARLRAAGAIAADKVRQSLENESAGDGYRPSPGSQEEAIILTVGRPALLVQDGRFADPPGDVWKQRLGAARSLIEPLLPAVGRVQLGTGPRAQMIGTGWLIAPDVIVTNRHVAEAFCHHGTAGWSFGPEATEPALDFRVEHQRPDVEAVALARVIHVAPTGPDVALLQLARAVERRPVALARRLFGPEDVAVIGYPARDGRNAPADMASIFGEIFEVKRLAPGYLLKVADDTLEHDCSTLGGNSGSLVLGLQARKAVGLHFAGRFREANYAVPAPAVEAIAASQKVL